MVAMPLVLIGALNWGLVGVAGLDLVATILGDMSMASKVVYILVGLSALYVAYNHYMGGNDSGAAAAAPMSSAPTDNNGMGGM